VLLLFLKSRTFLARRRALRQRSVVLSGVVHETCRVAAPLAAFQ
jgi:hypothetical protein